MKFIRVAAVEYLGRLRSLCMAKMIFETTIATKLTAFFNNLHFSAFDKETWNKIKLNYSI